MKNSLILGFFDGVHIAHQEVIKTALSCHSILITFKESPQKYFQGCAEYILPREESLRKIRALGVDVIEELDFAKIASLSAKDYLEFLIKQYSPVSISTGFNHSFGQQKKGNPEFLFKNQDKYNYKYFCISPQKDENDIISSTLIKKLLSEGNIERANRLLGSNFILQETVIHGEGLASKIGFPTANLIYPKEIVKIPFGVYSARIFERCAILNWGIKPTFNNTTEPILELHIPNFNENLYGKKLRIEIIKKIREEKKFSGIEELREQINEDINKCLEL